MKWQGKYKIVSDKNFKGGLFEYFLRQAKASSDVKFSAPTTGTQEQRITFLKDY